MLISRVLRVDNRQSTALISVNFEIIVCAFIVLLFVHVAHSTSLSSSNSGSNGNGGIGGGPKTFYIHWNTSNSVFRIDNTDHIYDINRGNSRFEYDQMNIVCPVYQRPSPSSSAALQQQPNEDEMEKYIIYNVSKEEYETCRITNPNPRIIAICDKPYKLMYFTITFRPFTPQPGGLEFLPGHDYYFISTSSKDDLHRRIGGRCSTNNMKVLFKVWHPQEGPEHPNPTSGVTLSNETSWPPPPHHPPLLQPDASPSPSYSATQADNIHIDNKVPITQPPILTSRPTKKSKTYANHPNDVEKSSLTGSADSVFSVSAGTMLLISLCIMLR